MADMIRHEILPAVSGYCAELCRRAERKDALNLPREYETRTAQEIASLTDALFEACERLEQDINALPKDPTRAMVYSHDAIVKDMASARQCADTLETLTASDYWPFPTYAQLLFSV